MLHLLKSSGDMPSYAIVAHTVLMFICQSSYCGRYEKRPNFYILLYAFQPTCEALQMLLYYDLGTLESLSEPEVLIGGLGVLWFQSFYTLSVGFLETSLLDSLSWVTWQTLRILGILSN